MASKFHVIANKKVELFDGPIDSMSYAQILAKRMQKKAIDESFAVMNLDTLLERFLQWTQLMPRVQPFYAVKCNSDPVLLSVLAKLGCGFDCASRREIQLIQHLVGPHQIVYANPCKSPGYIAFALQHEVNRTTFDSAEELTKICAMSQKAELILRIRADDPTAECQLGNKFGCEANSEAPRLLELAAQFHQPIVGISFHVGSGCHDPLSFRRAIEKSRQLFQLATKMGHQMQILDIGGGFPGDDYNGRLFAEIATVVGEALDDYFGDLPSVQIIAEPGRYFATTCMSICAGNLSKNHEAGSPVFEYYLNDGVYSSFNCIVFDHQQPHGQPLFGIHEDTEQYPSIVWGPTCDNLDCVETNAMFPRLEVGDWLYYFNMGAYTLAAASNFNGFPTARTYYFMDQSSWQLIYGSH
ncbi:hypothetical protein M3Y97_00175800 [Aphelenchoides bicaudatus]|nr:hypothetical protein M3Y97_00175800 [Aphelenchoides bicaudatus]